MCYLMTLSIGKIIRCRRCMGEWLRTAGGMILTRENKLLGENLLHFHDLHHKSHIDCPGTEDWPCSLREQKCASTLHNAFMTCTGKTLPLALLNRIYNGFLCHYVMAHLAVAGGGDDFHIRVCTILINALRQPKREVTLFMVGCRINTLHR